MQDELEQDTIAAAVAVERALCELAAAYQQLHAASNALVQRAYVHPNGISAGINTQVERRATVGMARLNQVLLGRLCALGLAALVDRRLRQSRQDGSWVARLSEQLRQRQ